MWICSKKKTTMKSELGNWISEMWISEVSLYKHIRPIIVTELLYSGARTHLGAVGPINF